MIVPAFYSAFDLKIDLKNRLFVPSDVRRKINAEIHGKTLVVTLGHNKRLWIYPEKYYESLVPAMPAEMTPDSDLTDYYLLKFGLADRVEPDEQGRVVLSEKLLARAQIQKDVTLVGVWDHLELWNRGAWNAEADRLVERSYLIEAKGKEAMKAARIREGIPAPITERLDSF